jgi:ParB-like chromosome segregation protein Spo0J
MAGGNMSAIVTTRNETRNLADLKDDPKNPRKHSAKQIAEIAQSVSEFGYINPIVIRPSGMIIGGHGTAKALRENLGWTEAECRIVDGLSDKDYTRLGLALNKIPENSRFDDTMLADIMAELEEEERKGLGFSEKELKAIADGGDDLEVKEIETGDVADEFWISIRGKLADQARVFQALEAAVKGIEGVTVDIGTIAIDV